MAALALLLVVPAATAALPGLRFTGGPKEGALIRSRTPVFRFSDGPGDGGHECRIDRMEPFDCVSPVTVPAQADGWHRLRVTALDGAGLPSGAISRRFRIDTTGPRTRVTAAPRHRVETIRRGARVSFRFSGSRGAVGFQCRIDRRRWSRCRSPLRRWARPGRHRLRVRALDRAGNPDRSPAVRRWKVVRWEPRIRAARRYARRRAGPVSFAVDVGWRRQGFRQALRARSASTIKTLLLTAYLRRRKVRHRRLDGYERDLLGRMIRYSDNGAASAVRDLDGAAAIRRVARKAGMKDFRYSPVWGTCMVSARDYARFMRRLPGLLPRRHRRFALHQLASITGSQRWGVAQVRPPGWRLYFKGGWGISDGRYGGTVSHQMVLLKRGRWRIGLAILTQGDPSVFYGNQTLRGVARRLLRGLPR